MAIIADQFFRFWYRFVPKNMMAIASDSMDRIYDAAVGSFLPSYMGLVFEDICKQYLIYYAEQLPVPLQDIGEWRGAHPKEKKEVQVDIVALGAKSDNAASDRKFMSTARAWIPTSPVR